MPSTIETMQPMPDDDDRRQEEIAELNEMYETQRGFVPDVKGAGVGESVIRLVHRRGAAGVYAGQRLVSHRVNLVPATRRVPISHN